jgi:hypothetical protein
MTRRREFLLTACAAVAGIAIQPLLPNPAQDLVGRWTEEEIDAWMEAEMLRAYRQDPQLVLGVMQYVMSLRDDAPEMEAGREWLQRARASRRALS